VVCGVTPETGSSAPRAGKCACLLKQQAVFLPWGGFGLPKRKSLQFFAGSNFFSPLGKKRSLGNSRAARRRTSASRQLAAELPDRAVEEEGEKKKNLSPSSRSNFSPSHRGDSSTSWSRPLFYPNLQLRGVSLKLLWRLSKKFYEIIYSIV